MKTLIRYWSAQFAYVPLNGRYAYMGKMKKNLPLVVVVIGALSVLNKQAWQ